MYRVSIKVAAKRRDGRFMVVRESREGWGFAGGGLENGETLSQCATREVLEEAGCEVVAIGSPIFAWTVFKEPTNTWLFKVLYEATVRCPATNPAVRFVTKVELQSLTMTFGDSQARDYLVGYTSAA